MLDLLRIKFEPYSGLALKLVVETDNEELIEGNPWGDQSWGMTVDSSGEFTGLNILGKLLMNHRSYLQIIYDARGINYAA